MRYVIVVDDCAGDEHFDCWVSNERHTDDRVGWEVIDALTLDRKPLRVRRTLANIGPLIATVSHAPGQERGHPQRRRSAR